MSSKPQHFQTFRLGASWGCAWASASSRLWSWLTGSLSGSGGMPRSKKNQRAGIMFHDTCYVIPLNHLFSLLSLNPQISINNMNDFSPKLTFPKLNFVFIMTCKVGKLSIQDRKCIEISHQRVPVTKALYAFRGG